MPHIRLNPSWTKLMHSYEADHQHPINRACHTLAIPIIASSLPIGATVVGLPLAAAMFTTGWAIQFAGHAVERKKPSFVDDKRALVVGLLWWLKKAGMNIELTPSDDSSSDLAA